MNQRLIRFLGPGLGFGREEKNETGGKARRWGSLTTGRAGTIGQGGAGTASEVPQTVSDFSYCKGKQIAATCAFYARSWHWVQPFLHRLCASRLDFAGTPLPPQTSLVNRPHRPQKWSNNMAQGGPLAALSWSQRRSICPATRAAKSCPPVSWAVLLETPPPWAACSRSGFPCRRRAPAPPSLPDPS